MLAYLGQHKTACIFVVDSVARGSPLTFNDD